MTTNAFVLHKTLSGDTSAQVRFFTREQGVVSCLCKGYRTPKKQAYLAPFLPLWVSMQEKGGWFYAKRLESIEAPIHLTHTALFSGLYLNELLLYVLHPLHPQPDIFDAYFETLKQLACVVDGPSLEKALRRFEWQLLDRLGYSIDLTAEANGSAIQETLRYQFLPGVGFIEAASGVSGADLLSLSQGRLESASELLAAKYILRRAISFLLEGQKIKARALFVQTPET